MLIEFKFKNYKSFCDEARLDLSATKIKEFSERVFNIGKENILPVAAIFGANASGKSNIYYAFADMRRYVLKSFDYDDDYLLRHGDGIRPTPYLFDNISEHQDTMFEVFFTLPFDSKCKVYQYGFCIDEAGVSEEWLNVKAKTRTTYRSIFYRNRADDELDLGGLPKDLQKNIHLSLNKGALIISLGSKLKIDICIQVYNWFARNKTVDFADLIEALQMYTRMPPGFAEDIQLQSNLVHFLSSFDKSIQGFKVEKVDTGERKGLKIWTKHKKIDSDSFQLLPLQEESAGTLKMIALYSFLQEVLAKGSVLFVDELNARLHSLLMRNILLMFLNPNLNPNHAQLIFTSHDTNHLTKNLLRRDEIWFTKKKNGKSELYSLAEFESDDGKKIRKDENYEKNYLLGMYGAIPELTSINLFGENKYKKK